MKTNWIIWSELIVLFVVLPLLYVLNWIPFHKIIPLIAMFLYCAVVLVTRQRIYLDRFKIRANWRAILIRYLVITIAMFLLLKLFSFIPLLADFNTNPKLFYMILMYPLLSAFPQELIFREFFYYRYQPIFGNSTGILVINTILFSFAHIYFANWIVLAFTLLGGLLFSLTYLKTKSLLVVTIEHTLYGLTILCSGLATFFYKAF